MLIVVTGTATEIGKTWCTAHLAEYLIAEGLHVSVHKPVQSFDPSDTAPTDADVLGAAVGVDAYAVCPPHRWLAVPMAPPMAADALGLMPFRLADLVAEVRIARSGADFEFVEGAGGVRSPIALDGDSADLAASLDADAVVLVADAGLGTINSVRLAAAAVGSRPLLVWLNRFDAGVDLHQRNHDWLRDTDGFELATDVGGAATWLRDRAMRRARP